MDEIKKQKNVRIPFNPFPYHFLKKASSHFLGIGSIISKSFPSLDLELQQAEFQLDGKEYGAMMFLISAFYFIFIIILVGIITYKVAPHLLVLLPLTFGALAAFMIFIQLSVYPKISVRKKVRDIERNLVFALRTLLVQLRSGVDLFGAMSTVAERDFGELSRIFKKAIDEISMGEPEEDVLQKLATENPSPYLRKALWQLVNGMKGGADVCDVLSEVVNSLIKEQQIQIKQYGAALSLLSLMYMMLGVIIPALGITFIIILGSFPQLKMGELLLWILLFALVIAQFMYIGLVKSRRPNLLGG